MRHSISSRQNQSKPSNRLGAVVPMVAIMLPVILILSGFVVNLSYMELTRTELRIAADAATRAAGRTLVDTNNFDAARAAARQATTRNKVGGTVLQLADTDIVFGESSRTSLGQRYSFSPGGLNPNAVQVNTRRDASSLSGAVSMIIPTSGAVASFNASQSAISSPVELDVALVLDRSGSMAYGDDEIARDMVLAGLSPSSAPAGWSFCDAAPPGSRWRDLLGGVAVFNSALNSSFSNEHVALVTYGSSAQREQELTADYSTIMTAMDAYTASLCSGATNIGSGIYEAIDTLDNAAYRRPWAAKVIVVMTDGRHNTGQDPEVAATVAFNAGITVYTITFSAEADQARMQAVADNGGGQYFHAASAAALQQAFRDIARSLPTLLTD